MNARRYRYNMLLSLLLLVGFIFTSWISIEHAKQSLYKGISDDALPLTSHLIDLDLQKRLQAPIVVSQQMAHNIFIKRWLLSEHKDPEVIFSYLEDTRTLHHAKTSFLVDDNSLTYYHFNGKTEQLDIRAKQNDWYRESLHRDTEYALNVDIDPRDNNEAIVYVNHKVIHNDSVIGVVGVGILLADLHRLIEQYENSYARKLYFIDHKGRLLFFNDNALSGTSIHDRFPTQAAALLNQAEYQFRQETDAHAEFIHSRYLDSIGWYLIVEQSIDKSSGIDDILTTNLWVGSLVTILILAVAQLTFNHYQKRLEKMATYDKLTDSFNRQAFEPQLQHHLAKARNQSTPVAMLMMDIDHFKQVNDQHGHVIGDRVLQCFAAVCKRQIGNRGMLCRWGGEEFMVLLPKTNLDQGLAIAEKIHAALEQAECEVKVTVSIGAAQYHIDESEDGFIKRADAALYQAKQGRNQTKFAA
ncbi:diguanylate cyclase [Pseudoalteromonas piscicida]|uniref:sensor domain-containing diguanylate cyclase n=1 Tax=Pseudoalteromonas piscicida TaxID=43662 RepID=UPI0030A36786